MKGILGIITLCMIILLAGEAYADDPIKITISDKLHEIQFDGMDVYKRMERNLRSENACW